MRDANLAFVMLGSSDLDGAVAFYGEILGLRVSGRFGNFVFFETGQTTLALSGELAPEAPVAPRKNAFSALRSSVELTRP